MWNLIKQRLTKKTCNHDWVIHETTGIFRNNLFFPSLSPNVPICTELTLICKKCGKIKRIKL